MVVLKVACPQNNSCSGPLLWHTCNTGVSSVLWRRGRDGPAINSPSCAAEGGHSDALGGGGGGRGGGAVWVRGGQ